MKYTDIFLLFVHLEESDALRDAGGQSFAPVAYTAARGLQENAAVEWL